MKNAPEKIYLQVCEENECNADFYDHEGVTWCHEKIHDSDIEYTRADIPQQRKPLTFEQVEDCFPSHPPAGVANGEVFVSAQWIHDFAANIQKAAHGIKE
jgi:hypothetical protein